MENNTLSPCPSRSGFVFFVNVDAVEEVCVYVGVDLDVVVHIVVLVDLHVFVHFAVLIVSCWY